MSDGIFFRQNWTLIMDRMSSTGYIKNTRAENSRIVNIEINA